MTIDKAIEILPHLIADLDNPVTKNYCDALKLGIEALKRERGNRESPDYVLVGPLPGETK